MEAGAPTPNPTRETIQAASIDELLNLDMSGFGRVEVEWVNQRARLEQAKLDCLGLRTSARIGELAAQGRSESVEGALVGDSKLSSREAKLRQRRSETCTQVPGLDAALANGEIAAGHIDAVANAAGRLDPGGRDELSNRAGEILSGAAGTSVDDFQRWMTGLAEQIARSQGDDGVDRLEQQKARDRISRRHDRVTGMHHTHLELDPESDARLWTQIKAGIARRKAAAGDTSHDTIPHEKLGADVLVDLACTSGGGSGRGGVPEISVLIDADTLTGRATTAGIHETSDGTPLPVETIRRLACDADLYPIVLNGAGIPIDLGRKQRLASRDQIRALRAMYATCGVGPHCQVAFDDCHIHHVKEWTEHHGPTDLDNLIPACSRHHHAVHEGGWRLELKPDRTISLWRPDGTPYYRGITTTRHVTDRLPDRDSDHTGPADHSAMDCPAPPITTGDGQNQGAAKLGAPTVTDRLGPDPDRAGVIRTSGSGATVESDPTSETRYGTRARRDLEPDHEHQRTLDLDLDHRAQAAS